MLQNKKAPRVIGTPGVVRGENLIWTYMKTCLKCGLEKSFSEYHAKRGKPQPQCKACRSKYMAKHYQENRTRERAVRKAWYEKNKLYVCEKMRTDRKANVHEFRLRERLRRKGMSLDEYKVKLQKQNNACEICLKPFSKNAYQSSYIDHCHRTGQFRGLLCSPCNTALGLTKENEAVLKKAVAYLRKYKMLGIKSPSDNSLRHL